MMFKLTLMCYSYSFNLLLLIIFIGFNLYECNIVVINDKNETIYEFMDLEIAFASAVPIKTGIYAKLVKADPFDACKDIAPPPNINIEPFKWFVIANRDICGIPAKIKNAYKANYDGIIIYSRASEDVINISVNHVFQPPALSNYSHNQIIFDNELFYSIPALLVSRDVGTTLIAKYLYDTTFYLHIVSNMEFDLNEYLVPFAIVIGLCLIILICFVVIHIARLIRYNQRLKRKRLQKKHLKQIPVIKFAKGDQYDTCAICLEDYIENEKLRILPCHHAYHQKCIDPWLTKKSRVCPICKGKIILPGMSPDSDSEDSDGGRSRTTTERTPLIQSSSSGVRSYTGNNNEVNVTLARNARRSGRSRYGHASTAPSGSNLYGYEPQTSLASSSSSSSSISISNSPPQNDKSRLTLFRKIGIFKQNDGGETSNSRPSTSSRCTKKVIVDVTPTMCAPGEHSVNNGDLEDLDDETTVRSRSDNSQHKRNTSSSGDHFLV